MIQAKTRFVKRGLNAFQRWAARALAMSLSLLPTVALAEEALADPEGGEAPKTGARSAEKTIKAPSFVRKTALFWLRG